MYDRVLRFCVPIPIFLSLNILLLLYSVAVIEVVVAAAAVAPFVSIFSFVVAVCSGCSGVVDADVGSALVANFSIHSLLSGYMCELWYSKGSFLFCNTSLKVKVLKLLRKYSNALLLLCYCTTLG